MVVVVNLRLGIMVAQVAVVAVWDQVALVLGVQHFYQHKVTLAVKVAQADNMQAVAVVVLVRLVLQIQVAVLDKVVSVVLGFHQVLRVVRSLAAAAVVGTTVVLAEVVVVELAVLQRQVAQQTRAVAVAVIQVQQQTAEAVLLFCVTQIL